MPRYNHCRNRSLIPIADMEKMEARFARSHRSGNKIHHHRHTSSITYKASLQEDVASIEEPRTARQRRNLYMIYLLFLAEATMAASLSSQMSVLTPFSTGCLSMHTSFFRAILQCVYFFGSATGVVWGLAADRLGRRPVALIGLAGMAICCLGMGFASGFAAFAALRFVAGAISAAVTVSGLAMLADVTHDRHDRTAVVARLPVVVVAGQAGPLVAAGILHFMGDRLSAVLHRFPGLVSQVSCAVFVCAIAAAEALLLDETLPAAPTDRRDGDVEEAILSEKATFLGQSEAAMSLLAPVATIHEVDHEKDGEESLNISIIEALAMDDPHPLPRHLPSRISVAQMLTAPSIVLLLASFSILSLHASTFDVMLPHLGHSAGATGGLGLPCTWLAAVLLGVQALAALRIAYMVPRLVAAPPSSWPIFLQPRTLRRVVGGGSGGGGGGSSGALLPLYRGISLAFPALYILTPLVGLAAHAAGAPALVPALVSTLATLAKHGLAGAAHVLVLLLALSAAPDASSTGTLLGVVALSQLCQGLAVGLAAAALSLGGDGSSMLVVSCALWAALATIAVGGAAVVGKLRETTPRVGADLPAECFVWQGMFDAEDDMDEKSGY